MQVLFCNLTHCIESYAECFYNRQCLQMRSTYLSDYFFYFYATIIKSITIIIAMITTEISINFTSRLTLGHQVVLYPSVDAYWHFKHLNVLTHR